MYHITVMFSGLNTLVKNTFLSERLLWLLLKSVQTPTAVVMLGPGDSYSMKSFLFFTLALTLGQFIKHAHAMCHMHCILSYHW